jgi:hypothetical protein
MINMLQNKIPVDSLGNDLKTYKKIDWAIALSHDKHCSVYHTL